MITPSLTTKMVEVEMKATASSIVSKELDLPAPVITGLVVSSTNQVPGGQIPDSQYYFRLLTGDGVIYPALTAQPSNTNVPGGWSVVMAGSEYIGPLYIPILGPAWHLRVELNNAATGTLFVVFRLLCAFETPGSLIVDTNRRLEKIATLLARLANVDES